MRDETGLKADFARERREGGAILETARMRLRELTEADAGRLFDLDSDPEVMRYIGPLKLESVEAYRQRIREVYQSTYRETPGLGIFAAETVDSGEFLGWFHLTPALKYRHGHEAGFEEGDLNLGYRLRREVWGKGIATEGAIALADEGFQQHGARRIVAVTLKDNAASIRVLEKAGLRLAGEFTLPGYEPPALKFVRDKFAVSP